MSNCANVYRISFDVLRQVRGSKDLRLIEALTEAYPDEDLDYDDDEVRPPALSSAFTSIINGESVEDGSFPVYAVASDLIYGRFGMRLNANAISQSHSSLLSEIDQAFDSAGILALLPIFDSSRDPPLLVESPLDFPSLSHMTPREVAAARGAIQAHDWGGSPKYVQEAIAMVAGWIEDAAQHHEGLVCSYG